MYDINTLYAEAWIVYEIYQMNNESSDVEWITSGAFDYEAPQEYICLEAGNDYYLKYTVYDENLEKYYTPVKLSISESDNVFNGLLYEIQYDEEERDSVKILKYVGNNETEVTIPGKINGCPVRELEHRAFDNPSCRKIKSIKIEENVQDID